MRTLILDNYDSFSYNLYQYLGELDEPPLVFRNDALSLEEVIALQPGRIVVSPGPGSPDSPAYFGICAEVIRELGPLIPILGVCLGHQGIGHVFGARVVRAEHAMHGKTSYVFHNDDPLFQGMPRAFEVMRYHSLVIEPETVPRCLEVIAKTWDGVIMGVRHIHYPIVGVQYHPESIGTPQGKTLLRNFLQLSHPARSSHVHRPVASFAGMPGQ
jgi:anthranilate synthase component II